MRPFSPHDDLSPAVIDAAAEWFVEFAAGEPDLQTRQAFDAWLRRSPEHIRAYLELMPFWDDATRIDAQGDQSADHLIQLARSDTGNLTALPIQGSFTHRPFSRAFRPLNDGARRLLVAAAAAVVGVAILAGVWLFAQRDLYTTGIGEQRVLALQDGSSIELNARSKLRVSYSAGIRHIDMLEGQALFRVAKDAQRPFVVSSGPIQVRALGTQFDVYRKTTATRVTVLEGSVLVSSASSAAANPLPPSVGPGSADAQAVGSAAGTALATPLQPQRREIVLASGDQALATPESVDRAVHPNLQAATAWREHRLVFTSTDLADVADEFNRYNERQIVVRNEEHLPFEVSGAFSVTDVASLLAFLHSQKNIEVDETQQRVVVTIKPSTR